jgi:hypothetical protein
MDGLTAMVATLAGEILATHQPNWFQVSVPCGARQLLAIFSFLKNGQRKSASGALLLSH